MSDDIFRIIAEEIQYAKELLRRIFTDNDEEQARKIACKDPILACASLLK
ncbi:hypothetical protein [Anaerolinea sp.]|nr:hypothetical protein [Anaerolinea sp.]